jgi:predicted PurR-regulated permease PerM
MSDTMAETQQGVLSAPRHVPQSEFAHDAGRGQGGEMQRDMLERHGVLRLLVVAVTVVAVLVAGQMIWGVIAHFGNVILPFFLAWVVSFILQPLCTVLERRGVPRLLAVSLIYLSLLGLVAGSIVLAIPVIQRQVGQLAGEITVTLAPANLATLGARATHYLESLGLSAKDAQSLVAQFSSQIPNLANGFSSQAVNFTTSAAGAIAGILVDLVLVFMLSFYMVLDGERLMESFVRRLPPAWHPDVRMLQKQVESSFGGFLRAQVIIALVYGILTWLILLLLGQPNGLLIAVLAGLIMLLPFIGPFLAVVPPAVLVILQSPSHDLLRNLVVLMIGLIIAQQLTMKLVAPMVMSAHVGLHPLVMFAALLIGAQEAGVWGALFAPPIAAVLFTMLDVFFQRFQRVSTLYPEIQPDLELPHDDAHAAVRDAERELAASRSRTPFSR